MNILVINSKRGHSRTLPVPRHWPWLLAAVLVVVPVLMGVGGYLLVSQLSDQPEYTPVMTERFSTHLEEQQKALESLDRLSQEQFRALTLKLAQAQARLVRLDALGERLVEVAERLGTTAYLIQRADEMDPAWLEGIGTIGLTAGASAPEKLVREVVDRLSDWRLVEEEVIAATEENMIFKLPRQLTE